MSDGLGIHGRPVPQEGPQPTQADNKGQPQVGGEIPKEGAHAVKNIRNFFEMQAIANGDCVLARTKKAPVNVRVGPATARALELAENSGAGSLPTALKPQPGEAKPFSPGMQRQLRQAEAVHGKRASGTQSPPAVKGQSPRVAEGDDNRPHSAPEISDEPKPTHAAPQRPRSAPIAQKAESPISGSTKESLKESKGKEEAGGEPTGALRESQGPASPPPLPPRGKDLLQQGIKEGRLDKVVEALEDPEIETLEIIAARDAASGEGKTEIAEELSKALEQRPAPHIPDRSRKPQLEPLSAALGGAAASRRGSTEEVSPQVRLQRLNSLVEQFANNPKLKLIVNDNGQLEVARRGLVTLAGHVGVSDESVKGVKHLFRELGQLKELLGTEAIQDLDAKVNDIRQNNVWFRNAELGYQIQGLTTQLDLFNKKLKEALSALAKATMDDDTQTQADMARSISTIRDQIKSLTVFRDFCESNRDNILQMKREQEADISEALKILDSNSGEARQNLQKFAEGSKRAIDGLQGGEVKTAILEKRQQILDDVAEELALYKERSDSFFLQGLMVKFKNAASVDADHPERVVWSDVGPPGVLDMVRSTLGDVKKMTDSWIPEFIDLYHDKNFGAIAGILNVAHRAPDKMEKVLNEVEKAENLAAIRQKFPNLDEDSLQKLNNAFSALVAGHKNRTTPSYALEYMPAIAVINELIQT